MSMIPNAVFFLLSQEAEKYNTVRRSKRKCHGRCNLQGGLLRMIARQEPSPGGQRTKIPSSTSCGMILSGGCAPRLTLGGLK